MLQVEYKIKHLYYKLVPTVGLYNVAKGTKYSRRLICLASLPAVKFLVVLGLNNEVRTASSYAGLMWS